MSHVWLVFASRTLPKELTTKSLHYPILYPIKAILYSLFIFILLSNTIGNIMLLVLLGRSPGVIMDDLVWYREEEALDNKQSGHHQIGNINNTSYWTYWSQ